MNSMVAIIIALLGFIDNADVQASKQGIGAIYTMSNGAVKNQILVSRLYKNGRLEFANTVDTNGVGVNSTGLAVLESQGALVVYSNYLFAVNAGSNTLSMFVINRSDATKLTLVSVKSVNGLYPISVAVNELYACVLAGGLLTGIRCFTYSKSGLSAVPSFDRNLTAFSTNNDPPTNPFGTLSQILFSADNRALIIAVKGFSPQQPGFLLFYPFTGSRALAMDPIKQTPQNNIAPFGMSLVGKKGLLVTDPGPNGIFTMNYRSNGSISNVVLTTVDPTIIGALCWSDYSPKTGNYYVIGAAPPGIVEFYIDLTSTSRPAKIVEYYQFPSYIGSLDEIIVHLDDRDYLFVTGTTAHAITIYELIRPGHAEFKCIFPVQQGDTTNLPQIAGIAAFVEEPCY